MEWDELSAGDMNGELGGKKIFEVSHRGQRSRTCASLCRESELAVNGAKMKLSGTAGGALFLYYLSPINYCLQMDSYGQQRTRR